MTGQVHPDRGVDRPWADLPSRIFTCKASMNTAAYTRSNGRVCQAVISSTTRSVIREIVSFDTDAP